MEGDIIHHNARPNPIRLHSVQINLSVQLMEVDECVLCDRTCKSRPDCVKVNTSNHPSCCRQF